MIKLKFERSQIQMERKKQIQLLEGIERKKITEPIIPDYICLKSDKPNEKIKTEIKTKSVSVKKNKNNKPKKKIKEKKIKVEKHLKVKQKIKKHKV